jgi:four helix bundle protein
MFVAYEVSLELITSLRALVPIVDRQNRELAAQIKRTASSVSLNLMEGSRSAKGNKAKHFAIAHGSANEARQRRVQHRWCAARRRRGCVGR